MISKQDTEHIAKLARLGLSQSEIKKFQKELSSILDYIKLLEEVDVSNIKPTFHPSEHYFESQSVMREDKALPQSPDELIKLAPDIEKRHIKVKSVF